MGKRQADTQINPNNMDSGDDAETFGGQELASAATLARRKIAVPSSRLKNRATADSKVKPNLFSAFAKPSARVNPTVSTSTSAFSNPPVSTNAFSGFSATKTVTSPESAAVQSTHSSEQLRTRGLNTAFHAQIVKAMTSSPFENWTEMCQKYITYAKNIDQKNPEATEPEAAKSEATKPVLPTVSWPASYKEPETSEPEATKPEATKPALPAVNWPASYKEPEPEEEAKQGQESKITSTGFQFGGSASTATSFKFGDKQVKIGESTTATSEPQGGFVFNPNGKGEIKFGNNDKVADKPVEKTALFAGKPTEPSTNAESKSHAVTQPVFNFSKPTNSSSEGKPAFSFGQPTEAGTNSEPKETKPLFTFGKPTESVTAPTFNFSQPATESTKPSSNAFNFGQQSANKSGLSFGSNTNPFGGAKVDATWKPSNPINFAAPAAEPEATNLSTATATTNATVDPSGEPSDAPNDVQTDLGGPGPGEENEDNIYEKKAKLYELNNGEYKPIGLGTLRVLKDRDTAKVRALLRAEGSGRVLLNIPIRKEFTYAVIGKGQVKLMDVKPGNSTPTIYVVRVKLEEDGNELRTKLEENKN